MVAEGARSMALVSTILFIALAGAVATMAVVGLITLAQLGTAGSRGVRRSGLRPGSPVPALRGLDHTGTAFSVPRTGNYQLLLFADHSLKEYPTLIAGLIGLRHTSPKLEVLVISRHPALTLAYMSDMPIFARIVAATAETYRAYNVRVMPFVIFSSPSGRVLASSLVNYDWQLTKLWAVARAVEQQNERDRGSIGSEDHESIHS